MRIAVVDGQGGGIGKHIIEEIRRQLPREVEIVALGTNALATSVMVKAGANEGASGENALIWNAGRVDLIAGSLSILVANSMLGEISPAMAEAIAVSQARKILLPMNRSRVEVVGAGEDPLPHQVQSLVLRIKKLWEADQHV